MIDHPPFFFLYLLLKITNLINPLRLSFYEKLHILEKCITLIFPRQNYVIAGGEIEEWRRERAACLYLPFETLCIISDYVSAFWRHMSARHVNNRHTVDLFGYIMHHRDRAACQNGEERSYRILCRFSGLLTSAPTCATIDRPINFVSPFLW